jgi:hypothetical protein
MQVSGTADFSKARLPFGTTISGYADRPPTQFLGEVLFNESTFGSPEIGGRHLLEGLSLDRVQLAGATFHGCVSFKGCQATSRLDLVDLSVLRASRPARKDDNEHLFPSVSLDLTDLSLERGGSLTRIRVEGSCAFQCTRLDGEFEITSLETDNLEIRSTGFGYAPFGIVARERLQFRRCQFLQGGILTCSTPQLEFAECDARQPLTVTSPTQSTARLVSLAQTNVEHFVLRSISLGPTRFANLANLDRLRLQSVMVLRSPAALTRGRQIIFDEAAFRARRRLSWRRRRWAAAMSRQAAVTDNVSPSVVAETYRALRKGLEDSRDAPGASDFYYGEMEMRRAAAPTLSFDRWLLTAYWLCAGYALRASRALFALIAVLGVGGYLLDRHGFEEDGPSAPEGTVAASLLLAQVTLALQRAPASLTDEGSAIVIAARIACPALLALAVLALRSRVKR